MSLPPKQKKLSRLISAYYDMHRANETAERILNLPPDFPRADDVAEDLMIVFVISYARPFTQNSGVGWILTEYPNHPEFGDAETKTAHERIMYVRNNLYAHANRENLGVKIIPPGVTNPDTGRVRDVFDFNIGKRSFIKREYIEWLARVPFEFSKILRRDIDALIEELFKPQNPTAAFELQTGYEHFAWGNPPVNNPSSQP
jgi:hypothetical protein